MNLYKLFEPYLKQSEGGGSTIDSNLPLDGFNLPEKYQHLIDENREESMEQFTDSDSLFDEDQSHLVKQLILFWLFSTLILCLCWYGYNLIRSESNYRDRLRATSNGWRTSLNHLFNRLIKKGGKEEKIRIIDENPSDTEELLFDRRVKNADLEKKKSSESRKYDSLTDKSSKVTKK